MIEANLIITKKETDEIIQALKIIKGIEIKTLWKNSAETNLHLIMLLSYYEAIQNTLQHWGRLQ